MTPRLGKCHSNATLRLRSAYGDTDDDYWIPKTDVTYERLKEWVLMPKRIQKGKRYSGEGGIFQEDEWGARYRMAKHGEYGNNFQVGRHYLKDNLRQTHVWHKTKSVHNKPERVFRVGSRERRRLVLDQLEDWTAFEINVR